VTSVIMAVVKAVHGHEGEVTGLVQSTQLQLVHIATDVGATVLLGIAGLAVENMTLEVDGARVAHVVTADEGAAACPVCGVVSTSVRGHAVTRPRDVPYGDTPVQLVWRKRRWRCREAACPRGSFTESLPEVTARARVTTRLRRECGAGIANRFSCVQAGALHYRISWPVAHRAYVAHVEQTLAAPLPPVCVLGIDETRRGKIKWEQDPATGRWRVAHDRWHTAVVDAAGTGGLLAHVDGRTAAKVAEWLLAQPDPWRAGITHVTIDLSASYLRAVTDALPDAVVVADRFHLVRLANDMLTEVRQRATRDVRGRRGRKKDPEWAGRRRLLTAHERLTPAAFATLWNSLIEAGDPGLEILHAYTVKENLRQLLDLAGTQPDREAISQRLWRFYDQAASSTSPEVHRLAATIEAWWPAVEAAITTDYSNARSEGYNRLAGHGSVIRTARGVPSA
jgi:transposase